MKQDRLLTLLKKHLESTAHPSQSFDELIIEAVGDYMAELMAEAYIPHRLLDQVEEGLVEEAWDLLRKLTYGSLSLEDYRKNRRPKRERRKASC